MNPPGMVLAYGAILVGQQTGLEGAQRNQTVSDDRHHDVPLHGLVTGGDEVIGKVQAGDQAGQSADRKYHDTQAFDAPKQAAQYDLDRDQPRDQRKRRKETEVQACRAG